LHECDVRRGWRWCVNESVEFDGLRFVVGCRPKRLIGNAVTAARPYLRRPVGEDRLPLSKKYLLLRPQHVVALAIRDVNVPIARHHFLAQPRSIQCLVVSGDDAVVLDCSDQFVASVGAAGNDRVPVNRPSRRNAVFVKYRSDRQLALRGESDRWRRGFNVIQRASADDEHDSQQDESAGGGHPIEAAPGTNDGTRTPEWHFSMTFIPAEQRMGHRAIGRRLARNARVNEDLRAFLSWGDDLSRPEVAARATSVGCRSELLVTRRTQ
jgi:hypothetical protein